MNVLDFRVNFLMIISSLGWLSFVVVEFEAAYISGSWGFIVVDLGFKTLFDILEFVVFKYMHVILAVADVTATLVISNMCISNWF